MSRHRWTAAEIALLQERYADTPTGELATDLGIAIRPVYQMANKLGLKKSQEYMASPAASRLCRGDRIGAAYRFPKGHVPANKGLRRPGWAPGRMAETQFKKGSRSGRARALYQPIGTERLSKDGYLERKINDGMPFQKRWRAVHLLVWEEANGPLPSGHAVTFKDGDKRNVSLDNLQLVTRADLMRRNTYHQYGPEIAQLVQLRGAISRQINKRTRQP